MAFDEEATAQPLAAAILEKGRCPICDRPIEKIDAHGAMINHAPTCALTSTHPDSDRVRGLGVK